MRDPLVTPAVGDVIEGREGDNAYRWTVENVYGGRVNGRVAVTRANGFVLEDEIGDVPLNRWAEWGGWTDVRVVSVARDPLVDPEPGDVVRAKDANGMVSLLTVCAVYNGRVVFVRVSLYDGGFFHGKETEPIDRWRAWRDDADVSVLS